METQMNLETRYLEEHEQYVAHLEELLLIYTNTIKELTHMMGE